MCIFLAILASVVTLVLSQLSAELALFFSSPLFCFTVLLLYEYERQGIGRAGSKAATKAIQQTEPHSVLETV